MINTIQKKNRKILLYKCGLPDIPETSHCFADATHHTCCQLGPEARAYADKSGNPIGRLSEYAYTIKNGKRPDKYTTWCTCTGSGVCGYYQKRFDDGTMRQFIGYLETIDEEEAIRILKLQRHRTPGVL